MRIGVFDSGIGGITVLRALRSAWPGHSTLYLGDTARVPYGTKSGATVARYARQNARFLLGEGIELLVVACNTASAYALEALTEDLPVPVIGVIEPGAAAAAAALESTTASVSAGGDQTIAIIGTSATVASGAYERALAAHCPGARITARACPMFVPLVEEGWEANPVARAVAQEYLGDWIAAARAEAQVEAAVSGSVQGPEFPGMPGQSPALMPGAASSTQSGIAQVPRALVLGCTHYPVLKPLLAELLGPRVALIDSAEATAAALTPYLASVSREANPVHRLIVTDGAPGFARVAARLLGVERVELEVADLWRE